MNMRVVLVILAVALLTTAFPALAHDNIEHPSDLEYVISALGIVAIMLAVIVPVKKKRNIDHWFIKKDKEKE